MGTSVDRLDAMAAKLEATVDYCVLRRAGRRERFDEPDETLTRVGVVLDVETSGLDPRQRIYAHPVEEEDDEIGLTLQTPLAGLCMAHCGRRQNLLPVYNSERFAADFTAV